MRTHFQTLILLRLIMKQQKVETDEGAQRGGRGVEPLSKVIIIIIMLYVGHSPQKTAKIMQEKNKGLVTQDETFGIINTADFSVINITYISGNNFKEERK